MIDDQDRCEWVNVSRGTSSIEAYLGFYKGGCPIHLKGAPEVSSVFTIGPLIGPWPPLICEKFRMWPKMQPYREVAPIV